MGKGHEISAPHHSALRNVVRPATGHGLGEGDPELGSHEMVYTLRELRKPWVGRDQVAGSLWSNLSQSGTGIRSVFSRLHLHPHPLAQVAFISFLHQPRCSIVCFPFCPTWSLPRRSGCTTPLLRALQGSPFLLGYNPDSARRPTWSCDVTPPAPLTSPFSVSWVFLWP